MKAVSWWTICMVGGAYVILWALGLAGVILNRGNLILTLMAVELVFLSMMLLLTHAGRGGDDATALVFVLLVLVVAAGESALGLAIFVMFYRKRGTISIGALNLLRG